MTLTEKPAAVDASAARKYGPGELRLMAVAVISSGAAPGELRVRKEIADEAESLRERGLTPRHASRVLRERNGRGGRREHETPVSDAELRRAARVFLTELTPEEVRESSEVLRGRPWQRRFYAAVADQMDVLLVKGYRPAVTR
jgi:hypothetical protein